MKNKISAWIPCMAAILILLASCSTTKRIPEGEMLYTGLKKSRFSPRQARKCRKRSARS